MMLVSEPELTISRSWNRPRRVLTRPKVERFLRVNDELFNGVIGIQRSDGSGNGRGWALRSSDSPFPLRRQDLPCAHKFEDQRHIYPC